MPTLLSLFDYTGNWAEPFAKKGWNVICWDIDHESNLFDIHSDIRLASAEYFYDYIFDNFGTIDGILAAVPCTEFAGSGSQHWPKKDQEGKTDRAVELVHITLEIVALCKPNFWVIENPRGRIHKLVPILGKAWYFQPHWYGDPYTKLTGLWGHFTPPKPTNMVEPIIYTNSKGKRGSFMWAKYGGKSKKTKRIRSATPKGFAQAFCDANVNRQNPFESDDWYDLINNNPIQLTEYDYYSYEILFNYLENQQTCLDLF